MLKQCLLVICLQFAWGEIFSQTPRDSSLFAYDFLHVQLLPDTPLKFHYIDSYQYREDPNAGKRTEGYQYIHNGDPFRGAEDIFTSSIDGAGWLKNFDFGKFASVIFEVSGDDNNQNNSALVWTGKLMFVKLFRKRQLGIPKHKKTVTQPY